MTLTSPAFTDGGMIPVKHAQPGHDVSPALAWTGAPDSTASFVLIVHDADAAVGDGTDDVLHWLVWNIPGTATALPEGLPQGPQITIPGMVDPARAGGAGPPAGGGGGGGPPAIRQISVSGPYYRGPAAPSTGPVHHSSSSCMHSTRRSTYSRLVSSAAATRAAVIEAMKTHIRGKAVLVGLFRRAAPTT